MKHHKVTVQDHFPSLFSRDNRPFSAVSALIITGFSVYKITGRAANSVDTDQIPRASSTLCPSNKMFCVLNSAKHEILSADEYENANSWWHFHIN